MDARQRGPPPTLPPGNTESEKRGRLLFVDGPQGTRFDLNTVVALLTNLRETFVAFTLAAGAY
jgi:hypothetical protein